MAAGRQRAAAGQPCSPRRHMGAQLFRGLGAQGLVVGHEATAATAATVLRRVAPCGDSGDW